MQNQEIHLCRDYAEAVFQQTTHPLGPPDFVVNWHDHPARFKIYQQVDRLPLSLRLPSQLGSLSEAFSRTPLEHEQSASTLSFQKITTLLLLSHGILSRRLRINWGNGNTILHTRSEGAVYGRGTPSGGGLYPTEVYWACGPSQDLTAGLYHYDPAHHALERLYIGDLTEKIRKAAFNHPFTTVTDQFLLVTLNFWKSAFKYANFTYHLITQDLGALLGSFHIVATSLGTQLPLLFWFQDEMLNQLLGLNTLEESTFALIPLLPCPSLQSLTPDNIDPINLPAHENTQSNPRFFAPTLTSFQRSKTLVRFPLIEQIHQSALIEHELLPQWPDGYFSSPESMLAEDELALPPVQANQFRYDAVETVMQRRQSSFGTFSSCYSLPLSSLATILHAGATAAYYTSDCKPLQCLPPTLHLMAFVNHVDGLEHGLYAYHPTRHALQTVQKVDMTLFLQRNYPLKNYNLAETAAVIMITGRPEQMLQLYGNRGYRILNAQVGISAQCIYLTATALDLGCGAVLGFNHQTINLMVGFEATDRRSLLLLLLGPEKEQQANFDYRLL